MGIGGLNERDWWQSAVRQLGCELRKILNVARGVSGDEVLEWILILLVVAAHAELFGIPGPANLLCGELITYMGESVRRGHGVRIVARPKDGFNAEGKIVVGCGHQIELVGGGVAQH